MRIVSEANRWWFESVSLWLLEFVEERADVEDRLQCNYFEALDVQGADFPEQCLLR